MAHFSIPPGSKVVIPETLRLQLDGFRRDLWRGKIMEAVAAGVIGLLLSFLLVYALDRVWPTPGWLRFVILIAGVSLFTLFAPYWLHRWVWGQRREGQLARLIAKRYPGLGDRLRGVIELQDQEANADSLSPRLLEAAMQAVALEAANRQFEAALPPLQHRRWALAALSLTALAVAALTLTPHAGWNAFQRWLLPLSKIERYTFTRLENPPTSLVVAVGEAFEVKLRLADNSEQGPQISTGRCGLQPILEATLKNRAYQFNFPGQQDSGSLVFRVGDLRHEIRVEPLPRPSIATIVAKVIPPAYLGISEKSLNLSGGVVTAVEGSKIQIELTSQRPLASAQFGPMRFQVSESSLTGQSTSLPSQGLLEMSGFTAKIPPFELGATSFELPLAWLDTYGLAGEAGFQLHVAALRDAVPTCYLQGLDRQKLMLPEETINFEVLAEDDFGVKRAGIEWSGQFTRPTDETPAKGEILLGEGLPEERRLITAAVFSPAAFGITPQKITLRAYTEDRFPQRARVYSEPVILQVLTRDEHAQLLKSRFDRSITELEDLTRRELELLDENQRLGRLSGEELQKAQNTKRLESQEQAEAESKRRSQELTERLENLVQDAARNGDIDKNTLQKMAESFKSMQELSQQNFPNVQQKLGDSQQASNTAEKAAKDLTQAVEQQQKAVDKMQQALAKANDANRQFEAGTFVNRLQKAASEQEEIASSLIASYERILGVKLSKLDPSAQRRLKEMSGQQVKTASEVRWLQEDLGNYFARTQTDYFKQILEEMKASRLDLGLELTRNLLEVNHGYLATENLRKWSEQLNAWAKKLDGDSKKGAGGGSASGAQSPEDEDFEFMLRVMKLVQQQQDLRGQTRALEQFRRDSGLTSPAIHQP